MTICKQLLQNTILLHHQPTLTGMLKYQDLLCSFVLIFYNHLQR